MKHVGTAAFVVLWSAIAVCSQARADSRGRCNRSIESSTIQLPKDDAVHPPTPYSFEWFYWTSHLEAADGRKFGFLDIIYHTVAELEPGLGTPIQYSDTTVSDLSEGTYHYGGRAFEYGPAKPVRNGFEFSIGDNHVKGGDGRDELRAVVDDGAKRYAVHLWLYSLKPAVQQISESYLREYARTRVATLGTIEVEGELIPVFGYSVFDHAFGDQLPQLAQVDNWTWMSLQLDDDREIVLLRMVRHDGSTMEYAYVIDANCRTTSYGPGEFTLAATDTWKQSENCEYPIAWEIAIPAAHARLEITPAIVDQDIFVPGIDHYYEGEVAVTGRVSGGRVTGRGVVELTWFCPW